MNTFKQQIARNFSASSGNYEHYALAQQKSARSLAKHLLSLATLIPPGPVLEIGCGTGRLSLQIVEAVPGRKLFLADLAPGMIKECRRNLCGTELDLSRVQWLVMDGEQLKEHEEYALIVSGFTLQWFADIEGTLASFCEALRPGGQLLFSYLTNESFPEWRGACAELGIPCTVNLLPGKDMVLNCLGRFAKVKNWSDSVSVSYGSARDFFYSFKHTGTNTTSEAPLNPVQMKRVMKYWDQLSANDGIVSTYSINYVIAEK